MYALKSNQTTITTRCLQGFILAMVANEIASRPASDTLTYGPVRAEVLSALFSTVTILVLSLFLVYSAVCRLIGELIQTQVMFMDNICASFVLRCY